MLGRDLRRRVPVSRRVRRPPHPSPSPSPSPSGPRRPSREVNRPIPKPPRQIEVLKRCNSEPALLKVWVGDRDQHRNLTPPEAEGVFFRPQTCADIFSPSSEYFLSPRSPRKSSELQRYSKDAKVVVNVTVEGSPGPVRTMVKLRSSVEDTIKQVIDKYTEEGRSPRLDKEATSTFDLHPSYFSLQSLNKSDAIGDAGSRSFYLRKNSSFQSINAPLNSDNTADTAGNHLPVSHPIVLFQNLVARKINKLIRRTHKLWKILGCM